MDGLIIGIQPDGSYMKMTKTDLYFVDRYGNEECLSDFEVTYKQNSPTYDELYNHWLKTKDNTVQYAEYPDLSLQDTAGTAQVPRRWLQWSRR